MSQRKKQRKTHKPALTDEGREKQLISLAIDLAEEQLVNGSASSQVITHFLKLATTREKLEQAKIERENLLLSAKIDQIASTKRIEEMYETALNAMRTYTGRGDHDYD